MDIKVNQVQQPVQIEQPQQAQEADGTFKFTLVSRIEEQDLQNALMQMMEEITRQGDKLAKHRTLELSGQERPAPRLWYYPSDRPESG